jgi:hypothetical protein
MHLKEFYRRFENTPKEERFSLIESTEPTSLFVIFQQLSQIRAQMRYFEDREAHLLKLAEESFNKNNGKSTIGT